MYAVSIVLMVVMVGVCILLALEVRQRTSGRVVLPRRRFVLRMITGVILLCLLAGIFVGVTVLHLNHPENQPLLFLTYWSGCAVVALVLVVLAALDLRQVESLQKEQENEYWRNIALLIAKPPKKKDS